MGDVRSVIEVVVDGLRVLVGSGRGVGRRGKLLSGGLARQHVLFHLSEHHTLTLHLALPHRRVEHLSFHFGHFALLQTAVAFHPGLVNATCVLLRGALRCGEKRLRVVLAVAACIICLGGAIRAEV